MLHGGGTAAERSRNAVSLDDAALRRFRDRWTRETRCRQGPGRCRGRQGPGRRRVLSASLFAASAPPGPVYVLRVSRQELLSPSMTASLRHHARFFDDVLDFVPAHLYLPQQGHAPMHALSFAKKSVCSAACDREKGLGAVAAAFR